MMVVVLDPAELDLAEFIDYYDRIQSGLGDKFLRDFLKSVAHIEQFPRGYAVYSEPHRLCPLRRFKIGIFYHVGSNIYIEALIDLRRSPRWIKRRLRQ